LFDFKPIGFHLSMLKSFFTKKNWTRRNYTNFINQIHIQKEGVEGQPNFKLFFTKDNKKISIWNDVPLKNETNQFYFVNEIPKNEKMKMEINTKVEFHPIVQDVKNGKLREFTYGNSPFNYGALPQTFEDPNKLDEELKLFGDGGKLS
jgi:hypothetical protein